MNTSTTYEYEFPLDFRKRLIALALIPDWYARYGAGIIQPQYFETEIEAALVDFIIQYYGKYAETPAIDEVEAHFDDPADEEVLRLADDCYELAADGNLGYAADKVLDFSKLQAMRLAILKSVDDLEKGNLRSPLLRVEEALTVGQDLTDLGLGIDDVDDWAYDEDIEKIPTGILQLDDVLEGGHGRGEYGVILAVSGAGKTQTLVNFGVGAAALTSRCNVTHITLEMSAKKILRRYAARISGRFKKRGDDTEQYLSKFHEMRKLRVHGNIRVKQWPSGVATVIDIRSYIDRLEQTGYTTDLLIVDYPDLINHERVGDLRQQLSHTATQLRALAVEKDMAVWGASQANRSALNTEIVDVGHIAEDFGKIAIADTVLAISQTKEEYEEGLLRYFAAKVRDGAKNWLVRCRQEHESHSIIGVETLTVVQLAEERRLRKQQERDKVVTTIEKTRLANAAMKVQQGSGNNNG